MDTTALTRGINGILSAQKEVLNVFIEAGAKGRAPGMVDLAMPIAGISELPTAPTPYEVIYRKEKLRLLRYTPAVKRYETPVLFVYSLINRYYVLDFMPGRSLIEYLLEQGFPVYCIDWGIPGAAEQELTWSDYLDRYLKRCVKQVLLDSGAPDLTLYGYCVGGTMALAYTALEPEGLRNFVAQAVPVDFHDEGLLSRWTQPRFFNPDAMVDAFGNVPIDHMQAAFSWMDPVGQVQKWKGFFEKIGDRRFVELFLSMEHWASDNVPFPGEVYRKYIKSCYHTNDFLEGRMQVGDRRVELGDISLPLLTVIADRDGIVPPSSALALNDRVSSSDKTTLRFPCGHIGLATSSKGRKVFWPKIASWLAEHSAPLA